MNYVKALFRVVSVGCVMFIFYLGAQSLLHGSIWAQTAPAAPAEAKVPAGEKVPDEIALRIRNNQLDQARLQNQMAQMAQQYQVNQQAIVHDQQEMVSLKHEALSKANKDVNKWDVDEEHLVYIAKPSEKKEEKPEVKK
jgi:uncharacterized protein YciW